MLDARITFQSDELPVARQVERSLREAVVTLKLRPGEMISEQEIGTGLGVSRSPVREALRRLSDLGLVKSLPQRGTLVLPISCSAVEDARFIREAIESEILRKVARLHKPNDVDALTDNLDRQRIAVSKGETEEFFRLDESFHRLLTEIANCRSAWQVIENFKAQMDRVRFLAMEEATPLGDLLEQHGAVVECIVKRDEDKAVIHMRTHLREILKSLPILADRYSELFSDSPARTASNSARVRRDRDDHRISSRLSETFC